MIYIVHYYMPGSNVPRTYECGKDQIAAMKYASKRKDQGCSGVYIEEKVGDDV